MIHLEILIVSLKFRCPPFAVFWKLVGKFTHTNGPSKLPVQARLKRSKPL